MDGVKFMAVLEQIGERVGLVKLEWVIGLHVQVHSDDLEAGTVVSHSCPPGATEQIEQPKPGAIAHIILSCPPNFATADWRTTRAVCIMSRDGSRRRSANAFASSRQVAM